jgi:hypothetical protein
LGARFDLQEGCFIVGKNRLATFAAARVLGIVIEDFVISRYCLRLGWLTTVTPNERE